MNKRSLYFIIFTMFAIVSMAQQKPKKNFSFCGWKYTDTAVIREQFGKQLSFLNIMNNDEIVDIGSSSGEYEGCLCVLGNFRNTHFILVDIDSNCLNTMRMNNMIAYYSGIKKEPIEQRFSIVQNTVDSLYLPENRYKKVWLINTLHEIPDKQKMISDINKVLQPGGELILEELLSVPKHTIHGGCHQPLMDEAEIDALFAKNGFRKAGRLDNPTNAKRFINPACMIRFIKD